MKLLVILVCLSQDIITASEAHQCIFSYQKLQCDWVDKEDFLHEFYANHRKEYVTGNNIITISKGIWISIEYFPRIPINNAYYNITSLAINDAYVQNIDEYAFEDLQGLRSLDLSRNQLRNILFIKHLPFSLESLILADNRIIHVPSLIYSNFNFLDMSRNRIKTLNFENIHRINVFDISRNEIDSLLACNEYCSCRIGSINLSHNRFTEFKEDILCPSIHSIDFSFNNLTDLFITGKIFLNLSHTNVSHIAVSQYDDLFNEVDLSHWKCDGNLTDIFKAVKKLKYHITKSGELQDISHIIHGEVYEREVDLSHSTIMSFPAYAFKNINLQFLNLSHMNVRELIGFTFKSSRLHVLDLSHSHIEVLHPNVFDGLDCSAINLSFNKISNAKNVFYELNVWKIDLSFNAFKIISNNSFEKCGDLGEIILSNCFIERIESQAFVELKNLRILDLSNNKLIILEKNIFHDLPLREINLHGNKIKTIHSKAFSNLPHLKNLNLSHAQLHNLEMNAFYDLSSIEFIDLSHNDLKTIPPHLFMNTPRLTAVSFSYNNISTLNRFSNNLKIEDLTLSFSGTFTSNKISNLNVRTLTFEHSTIETLEVNSFEGMYSLKELFFHHTDIHVVEFGALNDLFELHYLDSQNLFRNTKHIKSDTFKDLRSLLTLNLSRLSIETVEPNSFRGLKNIYSISLDNNSLVQLLPNTFAGLKTLQVLDVSCNHLSEFDSNVFSSLSNLKELYLQNNKIVKIGSRTFKELSTLRILRLDHNNIGSLEHDSFLGLNNLEELNLAENYLTHWTVGVFQYLTSLSMLNLSHNDLKTVENGALSNLIGLRVLDLSHTGLEKLDEVGVFFSMRNLQHLFLDGNHLKHFDQERLLLNLKNIRYVGISHNKWQCKDLSIMLEHFYNHSVDYKPKIPVFISRNIDGIACIDVCDYIYCQQEYVQLN